MGCSEHSEVAGSRALTSCRTGHDQAVFHPPDAKHDQNRYEHRELAGGKSTHKCCSGHSEDMDEQNRHSD
jgi:hypothetical protein